MITRFTMPSRTVSASVLLRRTRASEIAAVFEVTTATHFYPNGYTLLAQRLVSRPSNYSDQSHDHKYFCTIHETGRLARRLHAGTNQQSYGVTGFEPGD